MTSTEHKMAQLAQHVVAGAESYDAIISDWATQRRVRYGVETTDWALDARTFLEQTTVEVPPLAGPRAGDDQTDIAALIDADMAAADAEAREESEARRELRLAKQVIRNLETNQTKPVVIERWTTPDAPRPRAFNWAAIAGVLRDRPGEWALLGESVLISTVNAIRNDKLKDVPRDDFEVTTRNYQSGPPRRADLYLRYMPVGQRPPEPEGEIGSPVFADPTGESEPTEETV